MPQALPPALIKLIRLAYSAEKAAALAYQGHAKSLKNPLEKSEIQTIEQDEWEHRRELFQMMIRYEIDISRWNEFKFSFIGNSISLACHCLGWFMPMYFAGRLESGNVEEYLEMKRLFHLVDIKDYDQCLVEMAQKEKEHELYFLEKVEGHRLLSFFQKVFKWGPGHSFNKMPIPLKNKKEESNAAG